MNDKLLSVQECADHLLVSRFTVLKLIKKKRLECMLLSYRNYRIPESALQKFIDANTGKLDTA